jgi:hypothetical protein
MGADFFTGDVRQLPMPRFARPRGPPTILKFHEAFVWITIASRLDLDGLRLLKQIQRRPKRRPIARGFYRDGHAGVPSRSKRHSG